MRESECIGHHRHQHITVMTDTGEPDGNVFQDILPSVMQTIRASTALAAQDINFYRTIDQSLSQDIDQSAHNLMSLANRLLSSISDSEDTPMLELGPEKIALDTSWKPFSNVLDTLFEKIDHSFDSARRSGQAGSNSKLMYLDEGSDLHSTALLSKRIEKPQKAFTTKIDNSELGPFKPKITSKPHSIVPFEESVVIYHPQPTLEDDVQMVDPPYYPHPYETEIDQQPYPDSILEKADPIPSMDWNETSATWVDNPELLTRMISQLETATAIAVDLEHHDTRSYYGLVCLMQISDREHDYIVDCLAMRDQLEPLNSVFTNPGIIKVFHGAFMDIIWLQRDLGLYVVSLFDTFHASKALGFPKLSLAYLLELFANFKTSKKYQLADWRIRPLPKAMTSYARSDTHFLLNIFDQLRNALIDADHGKLQHVLHESRRVAKRRFEYTRFRPVSNSAASRNVVCPVMTNNRDEPFLLIMVQYNVPSHRKHLIQVLYNWRDQVAREQDESPRYIMPNQLLVSVACLNKPVDAQKILGAGSFVSEHVRLCAQSLAEMVSKALESIDSIAESSDDHKKINYDNDDTENWTVETIEWANQQYQSLTQRNKDLLDNHVVSYQQQGKFQKVFRDFLLDAFDTTEYRMDTQSLMRHAFSQEISLRKRKGRKQLQALEKTMIDSTSHFEDLVDTSVPPPVQIETKEHVQTRIEKPDMNEIITIRNRQERKPRQKPVVLAEETNLDYANADKILLGPDKRDRQKPKKRAFDPYSVESEGPQGVKKVRRENPGKTSTFSTRKRK